MADLTNVYKNLQSVMEAFNPDKKEKQSVATLTTHLAMLQKSMKELTDYVGKLSDDKGAESLRTKLMITSRNILLVNSSSHVIERNHLI